MLVIRAKKVAYAFSNDLDLRRIKNPIGLTIQNVGTSNLLIDDQTQQIIAPGESYTTPSNIMIVESDFQVKFQGNGNRKAIIRYYTIVDKETA